MNFPEMIIFDYGNTLLYEPGYNTMKGNEALFKYVKNNKNNLTAKDVYEFSRRIFRLANSVRDLDFELHQWKHQRFCFEYLGLELSISIKEAEKVFWEGSSYGAVMPGADKMLDYINKKGIRSAVISNISFSENALTERINRLLPQNKFEFFIASSEYMFRKPSPYIFELALRKADLAADDVWFCGDNVRADVNGAGAVGMFPVWYDNFEIENLFRDCSGAVPEYECLHIHDWDKLIEFLNKIKKI